MGKSLGQCPWAVRQKDKASSSQEADCSRPAPVQLRDASSCALSSAEMKARGLYQGAHLTDSHGVLHVVRKIDSSTSVITLYRMESPKGEAKCSFVDIFDHYSAVKQEDF